MHNRCWTARLSWSTTWQLAWYHTRAVDFKKGFVVKPGPEGTFEGSWTPNSFRAWFYSDAWGPSDEREDWGLILNDLTCYAMCFFFVHLCLQFCLLVNQETKWHWLTVLWPGLLKMLDVVLLLFRLSQQSFLYVWLSLRTEQISKSFYVSKCWHVIQFWPFSTALAHSLAWLNFQSLSCSPLLMARRQKRLFLCATWLLHSEAVGRICFWAPSGLMLEL